MTLEELNRIVLEFLHKKGYSRTEAMLRLESSRSATPVSGSANGVSTGEIEPSATGPEHYATTYQMLKEWIESSLDMYQPELTQILYPLFVLMYLELLQEPPLAREFFASFAADHEVLHASDLSTLQGLRLSEHVSENDLASRFMKERWPLTLSPTAFDLLIYWLHSVESQGGATIIQFINQHFKVAVVPGTHPGTQEASPEANSAPLKLGRMPLDPELAKEVKVVLESRHPTLAKDFPPAPEEDSPSFEAIPRAKFRPIDIEAEVKKVEDAHNRLAIDPGNTAALPSVCMYTFHNTYDELNSLTFSADLSLAAGGFADSYVQLWDLEHQKSERLIGHSGPVYGSSFSPDNRVLLSCSADTTVRLWSVDTKTALVAYSGHTEPVWDVAFGPFGHYFATASHDQTARLWSVDHIYPLRHFAGHMSDVDCLEWHPNGTYLATGSSDKTARLWDVAKGSCVRVFMGHAAPLTALAMSPDGRYLASAAEDAAICLWDLGSGRRIKTMRGHGRAPIWSLSFSAGGEVLISGGADQSVRVWDVKREQPSEGSSRRDGSATPDHLAVFHTKRTPVYTVQCTPRNLVVSAGAFLG